MKMVSIFFKNRPWILFILAFVVLISAWTFFISLSARVPSKRLTAEEEIAVLNRGRTP
jgi:hypothetical protein